MSNQVNLRLMKYTKKQYIEPKVRLIEVEIGTSLLDGSQEIDKKTDLIDTEDDVW